MIQQDTCTPKENSNKGTFTRMADAREQLGLRLKGRRVRVRPRTLRSLQSGTM